MNFTHKKLSVRVIVAILIGLAIGAGGYYFIIKPSFSGVSSVPGTGTAASSSVSTSTVATASSSTSVDTSGWQTFTSYELGFSVQYPPKVTVDSSDPAVFKVSFPRELYFSTVYADDVSVSISASSTCELLQDGSRVIPAENVSIGGVNFTKNETVGAGAGNIYDTTTYDALNNNVCYRILVLDHHANGAGLYEGDPVKIAALTAARDAEYTHVKNIVNAMIYSFTFVSTPNGTDESAVGVVPASTIFLSTISPTTVSVGGKLTLIGQGFSGHDTLVRISNGSVQGILWGGMPTSDTAVSVIIPNKVCTIYTGASGAECPSYLVISPGIYTVDVANQNGTTDKTYLKVR